MAQTIPEIVCTLIGVFCPEPVEQIPVDPSTLPDQYYEFPAEEKPAPPSPVVKAPAQLLVPASLVFGRQNVDDQSVKEFSLSNAGELPLVVSYIETTRPDVFQAAHRCGSLQGGQSCVVSVVFAPTQAGELTGELLIGWQGDTAETVKLPLSGIGAARVAAPQPAPAPKPPQRNLARERDLNEAQMVLQAALSTPPLVGDASASSVLANDPSQFGGKNARIGGSEYEGEKAGASFAGDRSSLPVERCRIITADEFIPLVLDMTVNTQIEGPLRAHLDRDFMSSDGRLVLLPMGTKFMGEYEPLEKQGDTRPVAKWTRLIRPDGASMALTKTTAADAQGRAGLTGVVDNRFIEKYGTVIASTTISAIVAFATQGNTSDDGTTTDGTFTAAGQALNQSLGQVTAEALRNAANLAPRVTIPKSELIYAFPGRDWYFPHAFQLVELDKRPDTFSYDCSGDFYRDPRGIAQNNGG